MTLGRVTGGGVALVTGIGKCLIAGSAILGGPVFGAGVGLFLLASGLYTGYKLIKKGEKLLEEHQIRKKFNRIIAEAVKLHAMGDFNGFYEKLTEKYSPDEQLIKSLLAKISIANILFNY